MIGSKEEMRRLIDELNYYTKKYDEGCPEISDEEWDNGYFKLKQEEQRRGLVYPDSPTQTIHFETVSKLNKVTHSHPMLSLDKTKDIDEVDKFLHNQPYVTMYKMDGLTCSLTYEDGWLTKAETRGNGLVGEDILHNAKVIKNIPKKIEATAQTIVVDGEIICRKDDFRQFKDTYKNPRNFAAGSIRLLSAEECSKRNLSFVAWEMIEGYPMVNSFWERLNLLDTLGFTIVPKIYCISSAEFAIKRFKQDFAQEASIYPMDGFVFKFDDVKYGNTQGQTDHHLKNAIAYKLYDDAYETRLKTIEWTMGRTGVLTPVAIFDPIDIDGSIVEKASLHNVSIMRTTLGDCAYIGEPLKVIKANMIIPQIIEAGPKYDYGQVVAQGGVSANDYPEYCPICHKQLDYFTSNDGTINVYCSNPYCEGKTLNKFDHFCGKKGLDIKGLSKATLNKLMDWEWLTSLKDIFYLKDHRSEWIKKQGFGVASVDKILNSIEEHKTTTLDAFISAISIPLIGQTAAKDLASVFSTYDDFRNAVVDKNYHFFAIENFGEEMNDSLKLFNYKEADEVAKLLNIQPLVQNISLQEDDPLKGKVIVITGKLTTFKNRTELKNLITAHGGKVNDSITSKTDMLINNDTNSFSSKNKAAKERGIPIISELDFMRQYVEK